MSTYTYLASDFSQIISPDTVNIAGLAVKIQNESRITVDLTSYSGNPAAIFLTFSEELDIDQKAILDNIIEHYNLTDGNVLTLSQIVKPEFPAGLTDKAFGTNMLYNGTITISLTQPLSFNPIIFLTPYNSSSTPGTGSYLSYNFTPGWPMLTVVSSNPTDTSQFSWSIRKY